MEFAQSWIRQITLFQMEWSNPTPNRYWDAGGGLLPVGKAQFWQSPNWAGGVGVEREPAAAEGGRSIEETGGWSRGLPIQADVNRSRAALKRARRGVHWGVWKRCQARKVG